MAKKLVKLNKRDNLDDTFAEILLNLIEKQSKEIAELKQAIKEVMRKDRDCSTFGYHSAYVGLIDDLINIIEEDKDNG